MEPTSRRSFLLGPLRRLRDVGVQEQGPRGGGAAAVGGVPGEDRAQVALIDPRRCLHAMSQVCTVCVERCPVAGAVRLEGGAPVVDPRVCTGCGACAEACPAPAPAIRLMAFPRRQP
jgi:ferredoxin